MKLLGLGNAEKPQGYENLKENDELESVRIAAAAKTRFIEGEILRMECMVSVFYSFERVGSGTG